jgi:hypothetical protein
MHGLRILELTERFPRRPRILAVPLQLCDQLTLASHAHVPLDDVSLGLCQVLEYLLSFHGHLSRQRDAASRR